MLWGLSLTLTLNCIMIGKSAKTNRAIVETCNCRSQTKAVCIQLRKIFSRILPLSRIESEIGAIASFRIFSRTVVSWGNICMHDSTFLAPSLSPRVLNFTQHTQLYSPFERQHNYTQKNVWNLSFTQGFVGRRACLFGLEHPRLLGVLGFVKRTTLNNFKIPISIEMKPKT